MDDAAMLHTYDLDLCIAFSHPQGAWGAFSNFSAAFPVRINGVLLLTTEHLYQACRFPLLPELQARLLSNPSPRAAKMRAHKHASETRSDWEAARIPIMRWCLATKLAQHRGAFGALLLETGTQPLVEVSGDDAFWAAVPQGRSRVAVGANMLGRFLMELRAGLSTASASASGALDDGGREVEQAWVPEPPSGLGLRLLGQVIVGERDDRASALDA